MPNETNISNTNISTSPDLVVSPNKREFQKLHQQENRIKVIALYVMAFVILANLTVMVGVYFTLSDIRTSQLEIYKECIAR